MHSPRLRAADAGGLQRLNDAQDALDVGGRRLDLRQQAQAHVLERVVQVSIIGDRIGDDAGNRHVDRGKLGQFQLFDQLLLQGLAVLIAEIAAAIVIAGIVSVGGAAGLFAPGLIGDLHLGGFALIRRRADAIQFGIFLIEPNRQFFALARRIRRLRLFLALQHHVGLEGLADMRLQVERRKLQQSNRLLQLRRHGQLLTDAKLQTWLQHISFE